MTELFPLYEFGKQTCPLGFPMNQNRMSVPVWSYLMEVYRPDQIVELGAYNGGFTLAIGLHAWNVKTRVYSFDLAEAPSEHWRGLASLLGVQFFRGDVFKDQHDRVAEFIRQPGITFLLCDNGNKVNEFKEFAKYLKPGDVIAAHDHHTPYWYLQEVSPEQFQETCATYDLQPYMQSYFDLCGWLVYRKGYDNR